MKRTAKRSYDTLTVFVLCFLVYLVCNANIK